MNPETKLRICGIENISTVDWYGMVSLVVFCAGCNFRCPYCQNSALISMDSGEEVNLYYIMDRIKKNRFVLDSIVFTGGEPTLQPDAIIECAKLSKDLGLKVMLNTNGTNWENLRKILYSGYIDRVALDVKAPPETEEYKIYTNNPVGAIWSVDTCLKVCKKLGIEMEVRTTVAPDISDSPDYIRKIANFIKDRCVVYYLQQYDNLGDVLDPEMKIKQPPAKEKMVSLAQEALKTGLKNVFIKTRVDGLEKIG
jgi:pyruvate formate lyase activating enzyme